MLLREMEKDNAEKDDVIVQLEDKVSQANHDKETYIAMYYDFKRTFDAMNHDRKAAEVQVVSLLSTLRNTREVRRVSMKIRDFSYSLPNRSEA